MASLLLGTSSMASQLLSLSSSSSLSFSQSISGGVSLSSPSSSFVSISGTAPTLPLIYCGKGDRKTAKGKRRIHSFGNSRPKDKNKGRGPPKSPTPPTAPKKDPFDIDDTEEIDSVE